MTTLTTSADLVDLLRRSQLVDEISLSEVTADVIAQHGEPRALAQLLVRWEVLTSYQVEQLFKGKVQDLILGSYRLLEPLGEGGMGEVYKALHQRLSRIVAVKIIRRQLLANDPEVIRRFQREARATAQLSHPNIVIVHDADQIGDVHFIAMEYVEGVDLAKMVRNSGPLDVALACDFMRQAALGLQHAHECGMVHRDIKPSNLLVATPRTSKGSSVQLRRPILPAGPSSISPRPATMKNAPPQGGIIKILDMGLARIVDPGGPTSASSLLTQVGMVMGTPDFIAPEQARNPHEVDIRADLYGLGCTFYFLLAAQPPFPSGSAVEKLLMHQLDEPQPLEKVRPETPPGICAVIRKLMAKDPKHRYQTPIEVAEALVPYVGMATAPVSPQLTPVLAAPVPPDVEKPASTEILNMKEFFGSMPLLKPTPKEAVGEAQNVMPTLFNSGSGKGETKKEGATDAPRQTAKLKGHKGWVLSTAFAPNRKMIASGDVDGTIRLWGFSKSGPGDHVLPRAHERDVISLTFAADSQSLASGSGFGDGLVKIWKIGSGPPVPLLTLPGPKSTVECLAFSPDGTLLALGSGAGTVHVWDLARDKPREKIVLKGHANGVKSIAFAPDGQFVASGGGDGTVLVSGLVKSSYWSQDQKALLGHNGHVRSLVYAPDGNTLASTGFDQTIRLWDVTDAKPSARAILSGHTVIVRHLVVPAGSDDLLSVDDMGRVIRWGLASGEMLREWSLPRSVLCSVSLAGDGRYVVTGNTDGIVLVYRLYPKETSADAGIPSLNPS